MEGRSVGVEGRRLGVQGSGGDSGRRVEGRWRVGGWGSRWLRGPVFLPFCQLGQAVLLDTPGGVLQG